MLTKIKDFIKVLLFVKNSLAVLLGVYGLKKEVEARFESGFSIRVSRSTWAEFMNYVGFFRYFPKGKISGKYATIVYMGKNISFNCADAGVWMLEEVFGWESYKPFIKDVNFSNRTVVDIGAMLGDTPVYFSLLGAKKVVAVEPVKTFADIASENVSANHMEEIIEVIHAGVGRVPLPDISEDEMFKVVFGPHDQLKKEFATKTPVVTLESVVLANSVEDGLLKIDCEGWEYDILNSTSDELLRKFEYVVMEYHYGFEEAENRLKKAGFEVSHTKGVPLHVPERHGKYAYMNIGMLFAKRATQKTGL